MEERAAKHKGFFARSALLLLGWQVNVRIGVTDGLIASLAADARAEPGDDIIDILLPGMPNVHSHAFQRAMAGLAERAGTQGDDFWTWREEMYRFALAMNPDDMEAVAALAFVEMLESGFTRVGEFHYLHHSPDGRPYADIGEMAERMCAAADQSGLGLTLLPVFYAHGGFGGAQASPRQRRFLNNLDTFRNLFEASQRKTSALDGALCGVAPHSLRAATESDIRTLLDLAPDQPFHLHIAEQRREVEESQAWSGQRPVDWLFDRFAIDEHWCLVHATHLTGQERRRLAQSGAVAGLCPITEANLGDGIFPGKLYRRAGGQIAIGSDSNVKISLNEELRQFEYSQRLANRARNVWAEGGASSGRRLFEAALVGGTKALGVDRVGLEIGASADFVSLNSRALAFTSRQNDSLLDSWIFAAGSEAIDGVWVRGQKHVSLGRHHKREMIEQRFRKVMERLLKP